MDLHELWFPRSYVSTWKGQYNEELELKDLINHPCNVAFRHNESWNCKHTPGVGGDEILWKCAMQVVRYEGYARVEQYLREMREISTDIGKKVYQRFELLSLPHLEGEKPYQDI